MEEISNRRPERRRPSSNDVARRAGVSQATVSRTYSRNEAVSEETRRKVLDAARELGYSPNAIARGLLQNATHIVGIVMLRFTNPFYSEMLKQLTNRLLEYGYVTMVFAIDDESEVDKALPKALQYTVDGLIVTSASLSSTTVESCVRAGTPVVLLNRYTGLNNVHSVGTNNEMGGRIVAEHLVATGATRFAYVAGEAASSTNRDRFEGYRAGLDRYGFRVGASAGGDFTYESGQAAARSLLTGPYRPDAVFCANDLMAFGFIDVARSELGIAIPEDVCVAGFDDIPMASWPSYALTTYRQPLARLADEAVEILLAAIDSQYSDIVTKVLAGELVIRGSTRSRPAV